MASTEALKVRQLKENDHDRWYPLWRAYQRFYKVDIPAEVSEVTWRRLLDPGEAMFGAIALLGKEAVGIVRWLLHRSCWTVGDYCYLQDLFVVQGNRARGIGRELIDHVTASAQELKCSRVYWLTHETNTNAMILYDRVAERSGFVQYRKSQFLFLRLSLRGRCFQACIESAIKGRAWVTGRETIVNRLA